MGASGLDATAAATSHGPIQRPQRHRGHAGRASSAPSAGTGSRSCPGPCPARHRPGLSPRGGGPHPAGRGNRRPGHRPATPTLDEVVLHLTGHPAASETLTAATSGTVPPHDPPLVTADLDGRRAPCLLGARRWTVDRRDVTHLTEQPSPIAWQLRFPIEAISRRVCASVGRPSRRERAWRQTAGYDGLGYRGVWRCRSGIGRRSGSGW